MFCWRQGHIQVTKQLYNSNINENYVVNSKLFTDLRDGNILMEEHKGGCVLYERKNQMEAILQSGTEETQAAM